MLQLNAESIPFAEIQLKLFKMVKVNAEKILSVELPDVLKPKKITTTF